MEFGIQIEDGSRVLSQFAVEENTKAVNLYDWQRRAIDFFFQFNKAIFEVTTGAGKTFCSIEMIKQIWRTEPDLKVLIVVPKNIILEDTWFRELYNNGVSLTEIGVYYGAVKDFSKVTITNMQSIDKIPLESFDIQIYDEIHNYGTKRLLPLIANKCKYKIGLSATLERMDNKHYNILKIFDYHVFKYTPREALEDGVLNPFVFTNIGVQMDADSYERYSILTDELNGIMQMGGGFKAIMRTSSPLKFRMLSKMTERKDLVNNYKRKFDVVKLVCEGHPNDKIIIFNEFNKATSSSYWHLLDIGIKACVVHSGIPKNVREQYMTDFRNDKYSVILASKVLDEGYNLPKIDTAIIAAGNSTSKQTIQRMGRVLRKKDKHSTLYQIYVKDTIEEEYANNRAVLFKELCSKFDEYVYTLEGEMI